MKTINPLEWQEINLGKEIEAPSGLLWLRGSSPFSVFVQSFGMETVYSFQAVGKVAVAPGATFKVEASKPGRVFLKDAPRRVVKDHGESFTNIDRLPTESGPLQEVTRALRMLKLEERAMIRRIREERYASEAVIEGRKAKAEAEAAVEAEAKSEAEAEEAAK